MLRTPLGYVHTSGTILTVAMGSGNRSKCEAVTIPDSRPYVVNTTGPSISAMNIPAAEDLQAGDAQAFITAYQDAAGDSHIYFSTDSENAAIYYNKYTSAGSWAYANSQNVLDYGDDDGSVAVIDVVVAPSAIFYNTATSTWFKQIMYIVNQTGPWFLGTTAGVLDVAFSNNGTTWVGPYTVAGPSGAIHIEYGGVIWDGTNIIVIGLEGNLAILAANILSGSTLTYGYLAVPADPATMTKPGGSSTISNSGIYSPNYGGLGQTTALTNCTFTLSLDSNYIYMSRSYAYPVDYTNSTPVIPCGTLVGCNQGLTTFHNRAQLYSMYIGGNLTTLLSGTWTLLYDLGYSQGYRTCR